MKFSSNNIFPQNFDNLYKAKRVKFIEIDGKVLVYNSKDSFLLEVDHLPKHYIPDIVKTPSPPIKTLILHTTYECNFGCKHCYLGAGESRRDEMGLQDLTRIVNEFGEMGGLVVNLSGGEALIKKGIEDVIKTARNQRLRTVVLTNGSNLDKNQLRRIAPYIDGMTVGLDGLFDVNDEIRGRGTFMKTTKGLEMIAAEGIELSLTTLLTHGSIVQLLDFPKFLEKYGVKYWSLVMPRPSGRFVSERDVIQKSYAQWEKAKSDDILRSLQQETNLRGISVILDHILTPGAKKEIEENSKDLVYNLYNKGRVCWDNTLTIMPNGDVKCCLFFDGQVYDNIKEKSIMQIYGSQQRKRAIGEFSAFPVDICPFLEKNTLRDFEKKIT